jgi:hypothetical protein
LKVLEKCQLREAIQEKEEGLDSFGKTIIKIDIVYLVLVLFGVNKTNKGYCSRGRWNKLEHGAATTVLFGTRFIEEEPNTSAG